MAEEVDFKDANDALASGFDILRHADATWKKPTRSSWRDHAFTARDLQVRQYPAIRRHKSATIALAFVDHFVDWGHDAGRRRSEIWAEFQWKFAT